MPACDPSSKCFGLACRPRVVCPCLIVLTFIVYGQVGWHQFIEFYDDGVYVVENEHVVTGLNWENITWAFRPSSTKLTGNWHPLTWLSLMTDASLFGPGPAGFHVTNMLIHMANGLLLFGLLKEATGACWRSAFVAAIFVVHPLHVESVAWIAERKDVLSTFWGLIAIWSYVVWVKRARPKYYWLSLLAFVLSLLSKLMFVTMPFLLLLLDAWPLGRIGQLSSETSATEPSQSRLRGSTGLLLEKLPYFALTVTACFIAYYGQHYGEAVKTLEDYPLPTRVLNATVVYLLYIWKTLYPIGLAVFYPYPGTDLVWRAVAAAGILIALSALAVWQRRHRPYLLVGWLWYLGTLVPVIGLVQIGIQRMADRYMYFPMVGLLVALTWLIPDLPSMNRVRDRSRHVAATSVIGLLTVLAIVQAAHWRDDLPLFTHAARVEESSFAHSMIASEHAKQGRLQEAVEQYQLALALEPESVTAHKGIGHVYAALENAPKARFHFEKVIAFAPQDIDSHYRLGMLWMAAGRPERSVEYFARVLESYPDEEVTHVWIGTAYAELKQFGSAMEHFRRALAIDPSVAEARVGLAEALAGTNRPTEAIGELERVLSDGPGRWAVHLRLGELYEQQGETEQARRHVAAVLAIRPDNAKARELMERTQK